MSQSLNDQIRAVVSDVFDAAITELSADSSPETLERWDSMQHLNLVLALEQRFDIQLMPEEIETMISVGMVEHVGFKNYRTYLQVVAASLGEEGRFVCQGICNSVSSYQLDPWMRRYIFPNSVLPSLSSLTNAAGGRFLVENLLNQLKDLHFQSRAHYTALFTNDPPLGRLTGQSLLADRRNRTLVAHRKRRRRRCRGVRRRG